MTPLELELGLEAAQEQRRFQATMVANLINACTLRDLKHAVTADMLLGCEVKQRRRRNWKPYAAMSDEEKRALLMRQIKVVKPAES